MNKQIDLKALLESKMGDIQPTVESKRVIEGVERAFPKNLMFDSEATAFKPETKPIITCGARMLTVEEAVQFNNDVSRFIDTALTAGVDYGVIPNCSKPSLLKPGAEKIMIFLGLIARAEVINRLEDHTNAYFAYETKIFLIDHDGVVRAEGFGIANSKESKFAKQNGYSVQNIVLKMSKKRALVDAVLNVGALSGRFTQDIEDMSVVDSGKDVVEKSSDNTPHIQATTEKPATAKQIRFLESLISKHGTTVEAVNQFINQKYGIDDYHNLSGKQISQIIEKFMSIKI